MMATLTPTRARGELHRTGHGDEPLGTGYKGELVRQWYRGGRNDLRRYIDLGESSCTDWLLWGIEMCDCGCVMAFAAHKESGQTLRTTVRAGRGCIVEQMDCPPPLQESCERVLDSWLVLAETRAG